MTLENWLRMRWYRDNHRKYQNYFDWWFSNITDMQKRGFEHQMYNDLNNVLR